MKPKLSPSPVHARLAKGSGIRNCSVIAAALAAIVLVGCSATPPSKGSSPAAAIFDRGSARDYFTLDDEGQAREMVFFALGLIDTGYRFGGRNPEAGLDCSGMVAWIVENVSGQRLPHNAAQIAGVTRPIKASQLQAGDLVFFNTLKRPHSHMGIYIGDGRFIHAPSSRGKVRIERLDNRYFASRLDGARSLVSRN